MENDRLTVIDHRSNATYELSLHNGDLKATDLRQIKKDPADFGIMSYDPAFMNTAACQSGITFIDGDKGILRYRGYNIEDLAENCTFLEVAYLLLYGDLPDDGQLNQWTDLVTHHSMLQESTKRFLEGFRYDAHPMGIFVSSIAALSTVYPDAKYITDLQIASYRSPA